MSTNANQRTSIINVDSSRWVYQYDSLGQVVSGKKYWSDGTPVAGQQFEYTFDDIGNRKNTAAGGDQLGANLRSANYTANSLNQYSSRDVPGFVNVLGTATNTATVSLWGDNGAFSATSRKGDYFRGELGVTNTASPVWLTITNLAVLNNGSNPDIVTNTMGKTYVAKTPEVFYYDLDGNLTNDGRWVYTWDAENRLVKMESRSDAPSLSKLRLEFLYDSKGRRIQKLVSTNNGGSYVAQYTNRFVYDGWNLIAILNPQSSILQAFSWGLDLSGSEQGAGGVGGLLLCRDVLTSTTNLVASDGNGNVMALVNASNGGVTAQYEYDPFLRISRATGPLAYLMSFLGATKYYDWETGWYYYGYRYLRDGWWLSRDPIGELGFHNVTVLLGNPPSQSDVQDAESAPDEISVAQYFGNPYQFCWGDSVSRVDFMGLVPQGKTFFAVYPNYDKYEQDDVWRLIGGKEGPNHLGENSCAARVSAGLNRIEGEKITGSVDFINSVPPPGIAGRFISNARRMNGYLTRKWGNKSECSKTQAYYFKSATRKGDFAGLLKEILGVIAKCKCGDDFEFVAVVSVVVPEPGVSGHVGVVTPSYHDKSTPYGDGSDVWLLPPTIK